MTSFRIGKIWMGVVLLFWIAVLSLVVFAVAYIAGVINEAGGVKQSIIEAGKDVKDIAHEISEHEN